MLNGECVGCKALDFDDEAGFRKILNSLQYIKFLRIIMFYNKLKYFENSLKGRDRNRGEQTKGKNRYA